MAFPWFEDWTGGAIGSDPADLADWTEGGGSPPTRQIAEPAFDASVRMVNYRSGTNSSSWFRDEPGVQELFVSFYMLYQREDANSGNSWFGSMDDAANSSARSEWRMNGDDIQLRNGFSAVATSGPLIQGDWYRLEFHFDIANSLQTLAIFEGPNLHNDTPRETISGALTMSDLSRVRFGSWSNGSNQDTTFQIAYVNARTDAFAPPWDDGGSVPLPTPSNFTFVATAGLRELVASWSPVAGAVRYEVEVQVLTGSDPEEEADWSALTSGTTTGATLSFDDTDGVDWGTQYRGRVRALAS